MSRSRRLHRLFTPALFSRRAILRGLAAGGTLPLLSACADSAVSSPAASTPSTPPATPPAPPSPATPAPAPTPSAPIGTPSFKHGVASGDPLADRVILWTRVSGISGELAVEWELARDAAFARIVRRSGDGLDASQPRSTSAAQDYTVKIDARGLDAATTYFYRFRALGVTSPVGRTKTAAAGAAERLRLALVSCSNYATGYFNAYKVLAKRDVDAVLHVGDYFYEGGGAGTLGRANLPAREIVSLADYRARHALYRSDADLQAMTAAHPLIAVWDDHESTNNSWIDGAGNHQPETEGDWPTRKNASVTAYAEWMPIRLPEPGNPLKIWRRLPFGDLVDLFMLDTRLQRNFPEIETSSTGTESFNPERTMLGLDQRQWLMEGMKASTARWRVLGQQTMMSPHRNSPDPRFSPLPYLPPEIAEELGLRPGGGNEGGDNWGAYGFERDLLMGFWRQEGIANNVVLSGDIHTAWCCATTEDPYTPFNPLTSTATGAPGYNALTGQGAVAVEFTCMSVTSNNLAESADGATQATVLNAAVVAANPNIPYHNMAVHGFVLLDITRDAVTGEFWDVGSVLTAFAKGDDAVFDAGYRTVHGEPGAIGTHQLTAVTTPTVPRT